MRERASFSFALVSVAAALDVARRRVRDCAIALGGVAHAPWRAHARRGGAARRPADGAAFARAADAELGAARPLRDNGYKVALARATLIVDTLAEVSA